MKRSKAAEQAALQVFGLLSDSEREAFEERLRSGDPEARTEYAAFRDAAGLLALDAEPMEAAPSLRDRVLAVAEKPPEHHSGAVRLKEHGLLIASSEQMPWRKHQLPGVWTKTLFVDRQRGYHTSLVRLDPGSSYPAHRHAETEELFVLEGDFVFHGQRLGPGDYCRAEAGTLHQNSRSESGGTFLVMASLHDKAGEQPAG